MKKKVAEKESVKTVNRRSFLKAAGASALILSGCTSSNAPSSSQAPQKVIQWRAQSAYGSGFMWDDGCGKYFAEQIRKVSNGRLDIKLFAGGSLFPIPDSYDNIRKGTAEMAMFLASSNFSGTMKLANYEIYTPVDPRSIIEFDQFFYNLGFRDTLRKIYAEKYNIYYLGYLPMTPYHIISKKPINRLSDFKGMKVRATGLLQQTLKKLGALPTFVTPPEIYTGLAQGVIDAAAWGDAQDTVDMKLYEVAKYFIDPGVSGPCAGSIIINLDAWKALPDDLKEILQTVLVYDKDHIWRDQLIANAKARDTMKNAGVKTITLSPADIATFRKLADDAMKEYAAGDADSEAFLKLYNQQLKDLGYAK